MRAAGILQNLNPRRRFFTDLLWQIKKQRELGFRPIIMLDANGDWNDNDSDFRDFLSDANLVNIFHHKFGMSPRTYMFSDN